MMMSVEGSDYMRSGAVGSTEDVEEARTNVTRDGEQITCYNGAAHWKMTPLVSKERGNELVFCSGVRT